MATSNYQYETREAWLNAFVTLARPHFDRVGAPLPEKLRVSVGFTSHGVRSNAVGECWQDSASADGHFEIFLKPTTETDARIADILTHQLCRAAVGIDVGHGPAFRKIATALGLKGKMTSTTASSVWYEWALPILDIIGPMPYAALMDGKSTAKPKQRTNLLKVYCPSCGFTARITRKHIIPHTHLNCPVPDCVSVLHTDNDNTEAE